MKIRIHRFYLVAIFFCCAIVFSSFVRMSSASDKLNMPYKKAGLTKEQAAAHLLSRFTYGGEPNEVKEVVNMGLEKWLKNQLLGESEDADLQRRLQKFDALNFTNTEVENTFPRQPSVRRLAISEGYLHKDSVGVASRRYERERIAEFMKVKGFRLEEELFRQSISQKVLRAAYSENQLREMMTDFWFNHFNVALNKQQCAIYVPAYERDVIRPNVFGKFENLVLKTAKSPAMLLYLDNFMSSGISISVEDQKLLSMNNFDGMTDKDRAKTKEKINRIKKRIQDRKRRGGLNENYAREVMELHTLGVDGGYTQQDVTEVARVLTGWSVGPMGNITGYGATARRQIERLNEQELTKRGNVIDGDFMFIADRHDNGEKTVLGRKFGAGGGFEEGVELLKMLANHKSAAQFISKKLAIRFVNDNPPASLVEKMAKTFTSTKGDIKSVIITMVNSPEFWSKEALREKTKSPFELAVSAVRGLKGEIERPMELNSWVNKMGQRLYYYQAPTGFPDNGEYWINTGSLLNRMNFGLALTSQRIPGVKLNLAALNQNREPESLEAALTTYSKLIMPERDLQQTVARLKPMLNDPNLEQKVAKAADKSNKDSEMGNSMSMINERERLEVKKERVAPKSQNASGMLAQVVGVIIGSPEFQRK
jgi:uncharacterized protein (DUF1800 family)